MILYQTKYKDNRLPFTLSYYFNLITIIKIAQDLSSWLQNCQCIKQILKNEIETYILETL